MFKYGISCALETLPLTQPVTLRGTIEQICKTAKKIGYNAIELHVKEPAQYNTEHIRRTAEDYGLEICAVANGMEYTVNGLSLIDDDKTKREAAIARLFEHTDFAAALNARLIVGIMRGNIPRNGDPAIYMERFSKALGQVCDYAKKNNVTVVLESILRYINNYLCTVKETVDFISGQNRQNLWLHIDTHSMAVEERNLAESVLYCIKKPLGYVHFSDNNRMYPGGGALDFLAIAKALKKIDYNGYITVECLPIPGAEESARRAFVYMKSVEHIVEIENSKTE